MSRSSSFRAAAALSLVLALAPACSEDEVRSLVVSITTDLPALELSTRTRIDLFTDAGSWFDTRDVDTSDPKAFPVSFGVARGSIVRARIRIYPGAHTVPFATVSNRRLVREGVDRTPATEPEPSLAIDRLVRIDTQAIAEDHVGVYLVGACAGTPANLTTWESCIAKERTREALSALIAAPPSPSELRAPCTQAESAAAHVCIPGGVFVLGDHRDDIDYPPEEFLSPRTERLARVRKFWIDRTEFTVARYRAALARGFKPKEVAPAENDGPFKPLPTSPKACTFSATPQGRESFALSCTSWVTFRALCQFEGGDLPTEAQWEYVARSAGKAGNVGQRRYPWGDDEPTCDLALFGRTSGTGCPTAPWPSELAVEDASHAPTFPTDTTSLGVLGLAGSLSEFVLDSVAEYTDECWANASWDGLTCTGPYPDPRTATDPALRRVARGGSWIAPGPFVRGSTRIRAALASPFYGARCAYASQP